MSELENAFAWQIQAAGLPHPQRQFRFLEGRRYRADFAWPEYHLIAECQGGQWVPGGGAHQRSERWEEDCRRMNLAQIAGWTVLQYTGDMIHSGEALDSIEREIKRRQGQELDGAM